MTYSIASESLGGGVCFQACLLVCKGLDLAYKIPKSVKTVRWVVSYLCLVCSEYVVIECR